MITANGSLKQIYFDWHEFNCWCLGNESPFKSLIFVSTIRSIDRGNTYCLFTQILRFARSWTAPIESDFIIRNDLFSAVMLNPIEMPLFVLATLIIERFLINLIRKQILSYTLPSVCCGAHLQHCQTFVELKLCLGVNHQHWLTSSNSWEWRMSESPKNKNIILTIFFSEHPR